MIRLNTLTGRDPDFEFTGCGYTSPDPRLTSAAHDGQRLVLDRPPINGKVMPRDVYRSRPGYCPFYGSYAQIGGGQIGYYIDPTLARPFVSPLFVDPDKPTYLDMYVDPMGTVKPHYLRHYGPDPLACPAQLTFVRDTNRQREDIMARAIWKRNQTNYETLKMYENFPSR